MFHATHGVSKAARAAAGSRVAARASLSGTFAAEVTTRTARPRTSAASVQGRARPARCCRAATAVRAGAPKNGVKNTGFWITSLTFRITST